MLIKSDTVTAAGVSAESNGLNLTYQALKCMYVDSKPQPDGTNASISKEFLKRFGPNKGKADDKDDKIDDNLSNRADAGFGEQGGSASAADKFKEPKTIDELKIENAEDPAIQYAR